MTTEEKVEQFRTFDFSGNEEWQKYFKNFDISGVGYEEKLIRIKAKWYKRDIDSDFDVSLATTKASRPLNSPPGKDNGDGVSSGAGPRESTKPGQPSFTPRAQSALGSSLGLFIAHFMLVIMGVLVFIPLFPQIFHRYFMQLAIIIHGFKVFQQYGPPPFRPLSDLKEWAGKALPSTDFQYTWISLIFVPRIPTRIVVVPSSVLAAYHVVSFMAEKYRGTVLWEQYGRRINTVLVSNQRNALAMIATSEILVGFFMVIQLVSPARYALVCFIYWQWLRTRYFSLDAAQYHRQAWHNIGQKATPVLSFVPSLRIPLGYAQRWFTNPPRGAF